MLAGWNWLFHIRERHGDYPSDPENHKEELVVTVSIDVFFIKVFAKLGSDMKKPDAVIEILKDNFREKIWPLGAAELLYVSRATESKLSRYGIHMISALAKSPQKHSSVSWGLTTSNFGILPTA